MDKEKIRKLLEAVKTDKIGIDEALRILKTLPYEDIGLAKIDTHRDLRKGFPEVILCKGKTSDQITEIVEKLSHRSDFIMLTKADESIYKVVKAMRKDAIYYKTAKIVLIGEKRSRKAEKVILIISAGTADLPVAEEAAITAEIMGNTVERLYDVGVAGIHRLLDNKEKLLNANVIIVVAGMEGALASIVGGLVDKPVIAVPTSIGYGANFNGLAALLTMLNSCTPGVAVVNIDNGFGAGYYASIINHMSEK